MPGGLTARPSSDLLQAALAAALDARLDRSSSAPVALALSAGGDSLALLHLTADWCEGARRPLLALTVDHGLHPQSAAWTARAGRMAEAVGARWQALAWTGDKPCTGLPAAARQARHALLAEAARGAGACVVLLGHTDDDVAEGEALRAGDTPAIGRLRDWAPSPAWPEGHGVFLLRPMLAERRAGLRDWLRARGLDWHEDPANADPRFARARVRLAGSLDVAAELAAPEGFGEATLEGLVRLPRADLHGPGGRRSLAAALACAAGTATGPRGPILDRLLARLAGSGDVTATAGGARLLGQGAVVTIGRELGRTPPADLPLTPGEAHVWDGRFEARVDDEGWRVAVATGRLARLAPADRASLGCIPAALRGGLPVFVRGAEVRLAGKRHQLRCLVPHRFDAAVGRIADERGLSPNRR